MRKPHFLAVASVLSLVTSMFSSPAAAETFNGVCILTGTATLTPGITAVPNAAADFEFQTNPDGTNVCTGLLGTTPVTDMAASASASGSGNVIGLGCVASDGTGSGTLTIGGVGFPFGLTIAGTGPQVTLLVLGTGGGAATGQASFAADADAATGCASAGGAGSLDFVIGAKAVNLTN